MMENLTPITTSNISVAISSIYSTFAKYKVFPFFEREFGSIYSFSAFRDFLEECACYNYHYNPAYFDGTNAKKSFARLIDICLENLNSVGYTYEDKLPNDNLNKGQLDGEDIEKSTSGSSSKNGTDSTTKNASESNSDVVSKTQTHNGEDTRTITPNRKIIVEYSGANTQVSEGNTKKAYEDTPVNVDATSISDVSAPSRKENAFDDYTNTETLGTKTEQTFSGEEKEVKAYGNTIVNSDTKTTDNSKNETTSGESSTEVSTSSTEQTRKNKKNFDNFLKYIENFENYLSYQKIIEKVFKRAIYEYVVLF